jgi:hypothetical protein|tara:strand:+ start:869 stop:1894 length:1026 start_codon:yes stop_codon:yes gene_type:complete
VPETFYFGKELKVYLENSGGLFWRIPVTTEPEFNQANKNQNVDVTTLPQYTGSQISSTSSLKTFKIQNDEASWGFATQMNPYNGGSKNSTEGILWEHFTGQAITETGDLDNEFSLKEVYPTFNLYFIYANNKGYKMSNCVVTSANISISLSQLATISWSGKGTKLEPVTLSTPSTIQNSAALATTNRIINNLSTFSLGAVSGNNLSGNVVLTSGFIEMNVAHTGINIDILGEVNDVVSFSRGAISVRGSFEAYVVGSGAESKTKQLINEIRLESDPLSSLTFNIGGTTATKSVTINIPKAFLNNASLNSSGLLTFSSDFVGTQDSSSATVNTSSVVKITYN